MALGQNKNTGTSTEYTIKVKRAKQFDNGGITFDAEINGVTVYGMRWIEGIKDGIEYRMVGFPSRKGSDGKYYNHAYANLDKSHLDTIEKQLESML